MGLGALTGLFLGPFGGYVDPASAEIIGEWVALPGYIFLGLLKMIVIPLIFASIILGVASSQNMSELKKTGLLTAAYSMLTTAIATGIGLGTVVPAGQHARAARRIQRSRMHISISNASQPGYLS